MVERATDAPRCKDNRFRFEDTKSSVLAIVGERSSDAIAVLEQIDDRALHVHVDPLMDCVVLERPDHLQTRAISNMRESRIFVSAEISLENLSVGRSVENRSPRLKLVHPRWSFLRV